MKCLTLLAGVLGLLGFCATSSFAQYVVEKEQTVQPSQTITVPAPESNPSAAPGKLIEERTEPALAAPIVPVGTDNAFPANPHNGDRVWVGGHKYRWQARKSLWKLLK